MTRTVWMAMSAMVIISPTLWADVKGRVHIKGADFVVADAVAYTTGDGVEVALLSTPFDRKAAARDATIDGMDVMRNDGASVTLRVGRDGSFNCVDWMWQGGGSTCSDDLTKALTLTANTATRIAGSFTLNANGDSAAVAFDLAVESTVARPGVALPAGGGEPGKAAVAYFTAIEKNNFAALKAVAPPDIRAQMTASEKAGDAKEMFDMMREITPRRVRLLAGFVDGDEASIDFEGVLDGTPVKGAVEVVRVGGTWYVQGTSMR